MKIGIVCFNLSWQAGGVRLIYSLAREMKDLGHAVIIYAPEINESAYPDMRKELDIRVVRPPRPIEWQYHSKKLLGRILEKVRRGHALMRAGRALAEAMDADLDAVNIHDFAYQVAPLYKKKNPRAKIVWTMNDPPYMYLPKSSFFYDLASRIYNAYKDIVERRYFKYIDTAVVLVGRNKQWAEERGMKGAVVWSGLDFERFYAPPKSIAGKKEFILLGVGALNKYRRFEDIVRAVKILRERKYDVRAVIVCKNIWKEDAYKEELVRLARAESVEKHILFLFDGASDEELKHYYASSDFFVLPIHLPPPRNGFGWQLVPFEAMAAGTPVLVSRKIDISEALRDGETARFFDPENPAQIADVIEGLIKDPGNYAAIARKGQDFVKKTMSWRKYAEAMLALMGKQS